MMLSGKGKLLRFQTSLPRLGLFVVSCHNRAEDEALVTETAKANWKEEMKTRDRTSTKKRTHNRPLMMNRPGFVPKSFLASFKSLS